MLLLLCCTLYILGAYSSSVLIKLVCYYEDIETSGWVILINAIIWPILTIHNMISAITSNKESTED